MAHIISYKRISRLRLSAAAKETLAYGLSLLFVVLFLYTVYHKIVGIDAFTKGIAKIPMVGAYSVAVAWSVLGAEALVALLLIWPDTNRLGLWVALGLMVAFTIYISSMLLFTAKLPCHCGGAIEKLTWGQHLLFNCGFIALAAGLLLYHYKVNVKHKILNIMATLSSKIKKAIFGMTMAALTLGFSAFTAKDIVRDANTIAPAVFFNESGNPSTDPMDYVYDSDGQCLPEGNACSAIWEHTGTLSDGIHPNGQKLEDDEPGTYTGNQ
ncbi:MauE/DoxX family redox-associated membrane protein [Parapedobacter soli]|uniref:MauE/DoxX family redox-associated membrane protein n=1 Tax=Parapedobacter soli TaxID=416955 RepID=UPI0021C9A878|nr:MauE/DoxX family redox-associated membrane protein [Parapedobacter soli]